jgi:RNA 2',3'-cyclic 3'-phosphodiesterase
MRLFVALDIDDSIRARLSRFVEGVGGFAPDARWVRPEALHITLKFIGEKPEATLADIITTLEQIRASAFGIQLRGFGFFPTAKAPRVFWLGVAAGEQLPSLAASVDAQLEVLGIPREAHAFSPHLTLARAKGGSGSPGWRKGDRANTGFQRLQKRLAAMPEPEFGTMTAREYFLYQSRLSPKGSQYTKLAGFALP